MSARHLPEGSLSRWQLRQLLLRAAEETHPAVRQRLHQELQRPLRRKQKHSRPRRR